MKRVLKLILLIFTLTLASTQITTYAFNTFNGHILMGGVGDWGNDRKYYWVSPSATPYESLIDQAMSEWTHTTSFPGVSTPISFRKSTDKSRTRIDFYFGPYHDYREGVYAQTVHFHSGDAVFPHYANWSWANVYLNSPNYESLPTNYYGNQKVGTIAHEVGHAFGLDENNGNAYSVLAQFGTRRVARAQVDDLNGINYLYD